MIVLVLFFTLLYLLPSQHNGDGKTIEHIQITPIEANVSFPNMAFIYLLYFLILTNTFVYRTYHFYKMIKWYHLLI